MKFLLDTSVYLTILLDRSFAESAEPALRSIAPLMYLSSVVRAELTQGAQGDSGRRLVARLARTLERSGRIIAPTHSDWIEAATAQSKIWDKIPSLRTKRLLNDLLIARTANRVGACIVTANTGDFELLHAWMPTKLLAADALLPQ